MLDLGFTGGSEGKESAYNMGGLGPIPMFGRSPEGRHGNPTPVFLPGKSHGPRNRWATVHGITKSRTQLSD